MEIFNRVMYSTELNRIISDEIDKYGVEDYIDRVNFDNYENCYYIRREYFKVTNR